jgi:predicted RNA-binding protein YlxR (DUF448 family)
MRPPRALSKGNLATPDESAIAEGEPDPHLTDGADEPETGPLRRCAVTRERLPKERMIRFVVGPDRSVVPDLAASLPGRGIWLSARADVVENARVKGAFARAARGQVTVPVDLLAVLQAALTRRIGDTLGLARRAGQAACGFSKAREWLAAGRVGLVVQARDGSVDERARFLGGAAGRVPVATPLDAVQLGAIFGRDHVVHAAIAPGQLATRILQEAQRLAGLSGTPEGQAVAGGATEAASAYRAERRDGSKEPGRRREGRKNGSSGAAGR